MRGLDGLIDYAGLFPPAALGLAEALDRYKLAAAGPSRRALGRFVAPLARIEELAGHWGTGDPIAISGIARTDPGTAANAVRSAGRLPAVRVEAVEARVQTSGDVGDWAAAFADDLSRVELFLEVPWQGESSFLLDGIARAARERPGTFAKLRTGGVEEEAFPRVERVARFIADCRDRRIRFKATAGLHHALRGEYPLTYESGSPCAAMHGLLGMLVAATLAADAGDGGAAADLDLLASAIRESDPSAFRIGADHTKLEWRCHEITDEALHHARSTLFASVGSCSFDEPIAELEALGLRAEPT